MEATLAPPIDFRRGDEKGQDNASPPLKDNYMDSHFISTDISDKLKM